MGIILSTLLLIASVNTHEIITCEAGVIPLVSYKVTLNTENKSLIFEDKKQGISVNAISVYTEQDNRKYYHAQFSFNSGVQMFHDGTEWWLCLTQKECLRCGQFITAYYPPKT